MNQKQSIFILLLFLSLTTIGQVTEEGLSKKELRKKRPTYINIGIGTNNSRFRDFATSPIFYSGSPLAISLSRIKLDDKRESNFGSMYSFGKYNAIIEGEIVGTSEVKSVSLYYSQLYQVKKLSNDKWNLKAGGTVNMVGNLRVNPSLQNNGAGIESVTTIFGSVKITKDISRKELKQKKLLFIKYKLLPKKRKLSYQFNLGVINSTYRNGYAYTGQSAITNNPNAFDGHKSKMFSGYRLSSSLNYTRYLANNNNAIQFSYVWDAYKTGGSLDKFEMVSHILRFSILFNTK